MNKSLYIVAFSLAFATKVRLNEPFANELEWFIPIQSVQITSH